MIIPLITIIIYWGRIKHAFLKSFTFKFKHHGRAFLSTMHSAIGMWVIPFYLLAALTGLSWSYDWYNNFLYKIAGVEKPQKMQQPQSQNSQGKPETPKVEEHKERKPEAEKTEGQKEGSEQQREAKKTNNFDSHQKAVEMFNVFVQRDYSTVTLRFPQKGTVYSFNYLDTNPAHNRATNSLELDVNSWQLLKHERYNDKPLNEQLMKSILPLHTGEYFGIIGQIGMFLASSLMALFTITGFMLYLNRHKKKKNKEIRE